METNYQQAHRVEQIGCSSKVSNAFLLLYLYPSFIIMLIYCTYLYSTRATLHCTALLIKLLNNRRFRCIWAYVTLIVFCYFKHSYTSDMR
jgi:hypothetical protein